MAEKQNPQFHQQQQAYPQAAPGQMYNGQQPTYQPPMNLNPRNAQNKALDGEGKREWNNGLCTGCCGGTWWMSFCCPCIQYGKNRSRMRYLDLNNRPHPEGGEGCGSDSIIFCALNFFTGCSWILECMNRGELRQRYNIAGGGCGDCCAAFCCGPCSLTQDHLELEAEEKALMGQRPV